jgi:hypothetical protein
MRRSTHRRDGARGLSSCLADAARTTACGWGISTGTMPLTENRMSRYWLLLTSALTGPLALYAVTNLPSRMLVSNVCYLDLKPDAGTPHCRAANLLQEK